MNLMNSMNGGQGMGMGMGGNPMMGGDPMMGGPMMGGPMMGARPGMAMGMNPMGMGMNPMSMGGMGVSDVPMPRQGLLLMRRCRAMAPSI